MLYQRKWDQSEINLLLFLRDELILTNHYMDIVEILDIKIWYRITQNKQNYMLTPDLVQYYLTYGISLEYY